MYDFNLNGVTVVNDNNIAYLGVKRVMKKIILTIDVDDRIKKFNISAYNVLINTKDFSEIYLHVKLLLKSVCLYCYTALEELLCLTMIYIRCIFHLEKFLDIFFHSLRSLLTELLDVFGIVAIKDNICKIRESVAWRNLSNRFHDISMLMIELCHER